MDTYVKMASSLALKIEGIIETHIHADHISGAKKLERFAGAPIYMFEDAKVEFNFLPLKDGDTLKIGNARIEVLHTPGHTPESISLMYYDDKRNPEIPSSHRTPIIMSGSGIENKEGLLDTLCTRLSWFNFSKTAYTFV